MPRSVSNLYLACERLVWSMNTAIFLVCLSAFFFLSVAMPITQWLQAPKATLPDIQLSSQRIFLGGNILQIQADHSRVSVKEQKQLLLEKLHNAHKQWPSLIVYASLGQNLLGPMPIIGSAVGILTGSWLACQDKTLANKLDQAADAI